MIVSLIDRIRQMDNDMIRIDTLVRTALKLPPDVARIARSDGKKDVRKDLRVYHLNELQSHCESYLT
jgi:hypothetical protein